jgi:hypothetical protein
MEQKYLEYLKNPKIATLIFLIITIIFSYPLYNNLNNWGIHDWDQHLFYEGAARISIIEHHQFPLWNPYQCGGNVLFANPQSSFLSIHFPITLLFGEVIGTKIAIMLYLFIGLLGTWFLSRHLKLGIISSYIPSIIIFLSGVYTIRMTVGHTNWFYLAFIPWIFLCYLKAEQSKLHIIPASLLLALMFFGGGIHPFMITVLILATYATVEAVKNKRIKAIITVAIIILLFITFAAIKLVPTLAIQNEMLPIEQTDIQPNTLTTLWQSLTDRHPDLTYSTAPLWQWHEYFGYIGILPLLLFIFAFFKWKETKTYIIATTTIFIIILSQNLIPPLWNMLYKIPFASLFHGPSRFLFAAIFFIAIAVGYVLTHVEKSNKKHAKIILLIIFAFLFIDLAAVNANLFNQGLTVEPQKTTSSSFYSVYAENKEQNTEQYLTLLSNKGIWNCYERFYPAAQGAIPKENFEGQQYGNYHGEAYIAETNQEQTITFWSPNKVTVEVTEPSTLILNQNYVNGWKAKVMNEKKETKVQETFNHNGAIATEVTEPSTITFYYLPNAFIIGAIITLITIMLSFYFLRNE